MKCCNPVHLPMLIASLESALKHPRQVFYADEPSVEVVYVEIHSATLLLGALIDYRKSLEEV